MSVIPPFENEFIRVVFQQQSDSLSESIEVCDNQRWIPILTSLNNSSTLLFQKGDELISYKLSLETRSDSNVSFQLDHPTIAIKLRISFIERDLLHFQYDLQAKSTIKVSKLIARYAISLGSEPDFTWVPHLRPKPDYVMGDHIFRSPAIIYQKEDLSFTLIPDLALLGQNRPFRTILDFNLKTEEGPSIYYGFGNYSPTSHVFFKHLPKKKFKIKKGTSFSFGYYIKISRRKPSSHILKEANNFLWRTYGQSLLYENFSPQILPYDFNAKEGLKAIFDRHQHWIDFQINGIDCGGVFQNTWLGKRKKKMHFISPENVKKHKTENISKIASQESLMGRLIMHFSNNPWWIRRFDWFTRTFPVITRTAEIWNNAWFLNIRTGYSFRVLGELWDDENLIHKGDQILNTVLSLPTIRGVFPSVIFPASWNATEISTINGLKAFSYTDDFHLADTTLTMYWALKYYQDCKPRPETLERSKLLVDLLAEIQLQNGAIPTYISFKEDQNTPVISDALIDSASSGAPLMFLTEYYKCTQDPKVLPIAEKIATYLQTEIIPYDKWHDFEPFFSCTHFPLDFYCHHTASHVMNALCIYWCAEGLKELYRITNKEEYLQSGERVLAILSLFQQIWDLPYLSYNTYGGFCSQNADAELSDARQGLFVRTYMEYYLITGQKEYMERAIATLRACWAMQLLHEYQDQCPGNLKGINTLDGVDRGCVCENYGHSGHDLRVPGYIMFDWGVGTSLQATAYIKKHFGDIFIDFMTQLIWGIDGILVKSFNFHNASVNITIQTLPNITTIRLKARDVPFHQIELTINGKSLGLKTKDMLEEGYSEEVHFNI